MDIYIWVELVYIIDWQINCTKRYFQIAAKMTEIEPTWHLTYYAIATRSDTIFLVQTKRGELSLNSNLNPEVEKFHRMMQLVEQSREQ